MLGVKRENNLSVKDVQTEQLVVSEGEGGVSFEVKFRFKTDPYEKNNQSSVSQFFFHKIYSVFLSAVSLQSSLSNMRKTSQDAALKCKNCRVVAGPAWSNPTLTEAQTIP